MTSEIQQWVNQVKKSGLSNDQIRQKLKESNYPDEQINDFLNTGQKKKSSKTLFIILSIIVSIIIISVAVYLALLGYFSNQAEKKKVVLNSQLSNLANQEVVRANLILDDAKVETMYNIAEILDAYKQKNGQNPSSLNEVTINYIPQGYENEVTLTAEDFSYATQNNRQQYSICSVISATPLYQSTKQYSGPATQNYCYDGIRHFTQKGNEYLKQYFDNVYVGDDVRRDITNNLVRPLHILVNNKLPTGEVTYTIFRMTSYTKPGKYVGSQVEIKEDQPIKTGENILWIQTSNVSTWKYMVRLYFNGELMTEIMYNGENFSYTELNNVELLK